ncbi:MAG: M14 family metallopeptidase [Candidatus Glassbacteria bacterium]
MAHEIGAQQPTTIESPEEYFGFKPGSDGMLFDYEQLIGYLQMVSGSSPRVKLVEIGTSPLGKTMYVAFISSEENIRNLERLKEINRRLALDPNIPELERSSMFEEAKVFILATLSMHSGEVGPTQTAPVIAYNLAMAEKPELLKWLDDIVYMMVPCHNPDGMDMIVEHYRKYKGTMYDGSSMPGVYHKYIGHDNNRDFIILSQEDTRAIARIYNLEWFPQVMVEKHQMGSRGPRYFVPPPHDPIAENVDEGIWNWVGIFGSNLVKDMTGQGLAGVSQHYLFDDYWPGPTETCIWKNVIGFLTEAASAKYATPLFIEPTELSVYGKGLSEYKKSINMPLPWPGGWWRLGDILRYEEASTMSIIKTASLHRRDILRFRNDLCIKEVSKGKTVPPYYYVLPLAQHDKSELVELVNLLEEHGIAVYKLSAATDTGEYTFEDGDIVIPLSQPFRPFIKEMMEPQVYPVRHYTPGGEVIRPYDITSWSLPLHWGLKAIPVSERSLEFESQLEKIEGPYDLREHLPEVYHAAIFTVNHNESFKAAFLSLELGLEVSRIEEAVEIGGELVPQGSFIVYYEEAKSDEFEKLLNKMTVQPLFAEEPIDLNTKHIELPRIGLVETYFHDMDAGWVRFIFDTYHIPFSVIRPGEFESINLSKRYDLIVFPDEDKSILLKGKRKAEDGGQYIISEYPPEFTKGIGDKGMEKLMQFIDKGGIIVSWGRSTGLFMETLTIRRGKEEKEEFQLPIKDISDELKKEGLYCPGSLMRVNLLEGHPITLGSQKESVVFYQGRPAFTTSIPMFDMDRRVIAAFPEKDILVSGYCENEEKIGNKVALVWLRKGKGQFVLFGFNPQFRASTQATFKLVFNSILLPPIR